MFRSDCQVSLIEGWLSEVAAAALEQRLRAELSWEQRAILLFGKPVLQPRLIAWAGHLPYRYSGQTLEPRPWHPELARVCRDVSEAAGAEFNHVLVNRYRDGRDSMGWHADAEPELGPAPKVATLSLGASRGFSIKPRRGGGEHQRYVLASGSLLLMAGSTQEHYVHAVPRTRDPVAERLSLTFREVLRAP